MLFAIRTNWKVYLIEAWALGTFMVSACVFTILLYHPESPVSLALPDGWPRRMLMGAAMGATLIGIVYSPWGKRSGAHMNPAITLANFQMERISLPNAIWYILAQFTGGLLGVFLISWVVPDLIFVQEVKHAVTIPGKWGAGIAFIFEFCISFTMLIVVLVMSNSRNSHYTGIIAGGLVMLYITFESPISGTSMNPARTFASAVPSGQWSGWWIYFTAPLAGMLLAGYVYRKRYRLHHEGNCLSMKCHLSGDPDSCETYEVLGPVELLPVQQDKMAAPSPKDRAMLPL